MNAMTEIETKAQGYANARELLAATLTALEDERRALVKKYMKSLRTQVATAKERRAELRAMIEANKGLFEKPRTRIFHGVKVGFTKGKGKVEFDDEAKTIELIRKHLPDDQVELLICTEEHVSKTAVADLSTADLKRLGIRVEGTGDVVVVKDTSGEIDKLVEALLKDQEEVEA